MTRKRRVDELLVAGGYYPDRATAERALLAGEVRRDDAQKTHLEKPGQLVDEDATFLCRPTRRFVSRGGEKLAGALADFAYPVTGLRCIDVGASTGGFTDCLLQGGAAEVAALDVAYGIIDWKLRSDSRVRVVERCNIRTITDEELATLGAPFDLLVADLSFISLETVFASLQRCVGILAPRSSGFRPAPPPRHSGLRAGISADEIPGQARDDKARLTPCCGEMILLVKPQFEAARGAVGRGGIVRDADVQRVVLTRLEEVVRKAGGRLRGLTYSHLKGTKGNIEFWLWVGAHDADTPCDNREHVVDTIESVVNEAHQKLD